MQGYSLLLQMLLVVAMICARCGVLMNEMSACHKRCYGCGSELGCDEGVIED